MTEFAILLHTWTARNMRRFCLRLSKCRETFVKFFKNWCPMELPNCDWSLLVSLFCFQFVTTNALLVSLQKKQAQDADDSRVETSVLDEMVGVRFASSLSCGGGWIVFSQATNLSMCHPKKPVAPVSALRAPRKRCLCSSSLVGKR